MKRIATSSAALFAAMLSISAALTYAAETPQWAGTWAASPQPVWDKDFVLPLGIPTALSNKTVRQIARVSVGGNRVRLILSNEYGKEALLVGAVHLARAAQGSAIVPGTDRSVTFNGKTSVTIPPGAPAVSDPIELSVEPLSELTVSLYLPQATSLTTFHWDGRQTAYIAPGNMAGAPAIDTSETVDARVFLSGIQIDAGKAPDVVVAFGDSLTDGNGSTPDKNRRWPDFLAKRLIKENVAVLNAGISGARVLESLMGENALARFDRDVLGQPRVKSVIVMMGINDIGWPGSAFAPNADPGAADEIIAGYRQLIARARARGVRIIGATIPPWEGALKGTVLEGHHTPEKDKVRQAVNQWIRTSGAFDALVDFDALLRDPAHPARLLPAFDSGDHLHPGDAGFEAMANAIDIDMLLGRR